MTLTFDLPEVLARQLLAMPEPERNRYVVERLDATSDEGAFTFAGDPLDFTPVRVDELPPDDRAAVLRGLADVEAGRVTPLADAIAEIKTNLFSRDKGQVAGVAS